MTKQHKKKPIEEAPPEDTAILQERVQKLEAELAEHVAGWQRARADYQNLNKEWLNRQTQFFADARRDLIEELLPIYDLLCRAVRAETEPGQEQSWISGIRHIVAEWEQLMRRWEIEPVATEQVSFDPSVHEAVGTDPDAPENMVVREVQGGYRFRGKLVQPARVIVGEKPVAEEKVGD